ncbi:MAG: sigma-70 family RNA polymerase sigma factor [Lachnospiraceae bacterium]|nr:sigma-70 family RNA polymerase sigma factor [Lachnospiraceae bacterium]
MQPTEKLKQATIEYKSGNAEAFTILYEESSKYIYTCIYKVMSGNDNANDTICDIMQDTYIEISRYITQLENEEKFLSWAGTIATRKCYAYLKKNKKYVLLHEEDDTFENLSDDDNIIPEEVMQNKEKQRLVREIIDNELTEM